MPRIIHHDRAVTILKKAVLAGAERTGPLSARWNISGNCTDTYWMTYQGRPRDPGEGPFREGSKHTHTGGKGTIYIDIGTRCRRCAACLKNRMLSWRYRAKRETMRAARNWWGTLTFAPSQRYRIEVEARRYAASRSVAWETLSDEERFSRIVAFSLKEVTKYLKRVRKAAKASFRYVLVTERHKSGDPHFHLIVHETELHPITHKILSGQWNGKNFSLGFEKWRLIPFGDEERHVGYVTDYISKALASKVRASQRYGELELEATVGALQRSFMTLYEQSQRREKRMTGEEKKGV